MSWGRQDGGWAGGSHRIAICGWEGLGSLGDEGFSEVGGVHVEVIRVVTDATPSNGEGVWDGMFG